MTNLEHIKIANAGAKEINKWQEANIGKSLDLRGADFRRADFVKANLNNARLSQANLEYADLRWADLVNADLSMAILERADFHKADLTRAILRDANLRKCNFEDANLTETDFSKSFFSDTRLLNTDLSSSKGLDAINHRGPSIFDRDTIVMSGKLPRNFLEGIGLFSAYHAQVFKVAIGSPGDVSVERNLLRNEIYFWNDENARRFGTVLLPVMWETHSTPELGKHPQKIIQERVLESCQLLVVIFWTRIGTETEDAISGTVDEIEKFNSSGKPVLVYFSDIKTSPKDIDIEQLKALKDYKKNIRKIGLIDSFSSHEELRQKLNRHLTDTLERLIP